MSIILAIDTSTQACSCALNIEGQVIESFDVIPRQHAHKLLPMIKQMLDEQGLAFSALSAVAYGQGPGSFTGLRIAAGVTQGIALGAGIPVVAVSSLASLAYQAREDAESGIVFSVLDARIDEVYWGFYSVLENAELIGEEGLCKPESLPDAILDNPQSLVAVGSGLAFLERMPAVYREKIVAGQPDLYPRAESIAHLAMVKLTKGLTQLPEEVSPVYLRDKVTHN